MYDSNVYSVLSERPKCGIFISIQTLHKIALLLDAGDGLCLTEMMAVREV
jgi:hypothetical protein